MQDSIIIGAMYGRITRACKARNAPTFHAYYTHGDGEGEDREIIVCMGQSLPDVVAYCRKEGPKWRDALPSVYIELFLSMITSVEILSEKEGSASERILQMPTHDQIQTAYLLDDQEGLRATPFGHVLAAIITAIAAIHGVTERRIRVHMYNYDDHLILREAEQWD